MRSRVALVIAAAVMVTGLGASGAVADHAAADAAPRPAIARNVVPRFVQPGPLVPVRRLDLGASTPATGWMDDEWGSSTISGGTTATFDESVDLSRVASTGAPEDTYRTVREGDFSVTMRGLQPGAGYTLRLHLMEGYWNEPGRRVLDVDVNGERYLNDVDLLTFAGAKNRAVTHDVSVTAAADGTLTVGFHGVVDQPSISALELLFAEPTRSPAFPAGRRMRVMAVGDSITYGTRDERNGGYRYPLYDLMTDAGWSFEPVGPYTGPTEGEGRWAGSGHLGVPGWRMDELLGATADNRTGATIDTWLRDARPDVVLLHIGNNDNEQHEDQTHQRAELEDLLRRMVAARPTADIYLARIMNQGSYDADISHFNETIADVAVEHELQGHRVHLVDMESAITPDLVIDGIHPSGDGYRAMAHRWFDALAANQH